jgi:uncharacterized short protein YbdD (DUF466 family)
MPIPTDNNLYDETKKDIMKIYKKSSAYSSGAIVKQYKKSFLKKYGPNISPYIDDNQTKNLKRWYKEKWIDISPLIGIKDNDHYPLYRPSRKISKDTPTTYEEIPIKRLKEQYELKQKIKGHKNLPPFNLFY